MDRRELLRRAAAVAVPAVAGCGGGGSPTVNVDGFNFNPNELSVAAGTTVTWRNEEPDEDHTVTSTQFTDGAASWSMDAELPSGGGTASHTFDSPGVYQYKCTVHGVQTMCGVVAVGDATFEGALPCV